MICILVLISNSFVFAQDSIQKTRLKIFDVNISWGLDTYEAHEITGDKVLSFTKREDVKAESKGYVDKATYSVHKPFGMEFGANLSLKFSRTNNSILKRIKPRIFVQGYDVSYVFDHNMTYSTTIAIDTVPPGMSNPSPVILDSNTYGKLSYSYNSTQLVTELGANVDLVVKKRMIIYSGILFGYGFSLKNEFQVDKYEWGSVDNPPGSPKTSTPFELNDYRRYYKESSSHLYRVSVPIGIQLRFGQKKPRAFGILVEFKPGFEQYKIKGGIGFTNFIFSGVFGLRYSFIYNK